jgi:hypothetical protein
MALNFFVSVMSLGSTVDIETGYWLDDRGTRFQAPVGLGMFTSPYRPDLLCGPLNLLSNGYGRLFYLG